MRFAKQLARPGTLTKYRNRIRCLEQRRRASVRAHDSKQEPMRVAQKAAVRSEKNRSSGFLKVS